MSDETPVSLKRLISNTELEIFCEKSRDELKLKVNDFREKCIVTSSTYNVVQNSTESIYFIAFLEYMKNTGEMDAYLKRNQISES